jgi:hypothetical protein
MAFFPSDMNGEERAFAEFIDGDNTGVDAPAANHRYGRELLAMPVAKGTASVPPNPEKCGETATKPRQY